MQREKDTLAIVLKKTGFGEADELVTLYTEEFGKVRAVAVSVKKSTSKLQYALQQLALVKVQLTSGKSGRLPKVIGAQLQSVFMQLRMDEEKIKAALVAIELVIIATPDEQPAVLLFQALQEFLQTLNASEIHPKVALVKYKIIALEQLGFKVRMLPTGTPVGSLIGFSSIGGGFVFVEKHPEAEVVTWKQYELFASIYYASFSQLQNLGESVEELDHFLSRFISYQLERDLKTEK